MARWVLSLFFVLSLTACSVSMMEFPDERNSSQKKTDQVVPQQEIEVKQPDEEPTIDVEIDIAKKKEVQQKEKNQEVKQPEANNKEEIEEIKEKTEKKKTEKKKTTTTTTTLTTFETQVVQLVNQERRKRGYAPLKIDNRLTRVARKKSADMRDKGYFSHQSPTYGSPFDMLMKEGIWFTMAGENIAAGQQNSAKVMTDWMNSEGHRKNILNPEFTHIGVGYIEGGRYGTYWTQLFIRK